MSEDTFTPPSLERRILDASMSFMRALDACGPGAWASREMIYREGEETIAKLLGEYRKTL
jgi:hypothetical protein